MLFINYSVYQKEGKKERGRKRKRKKRKSIFNTNFQDYKNRLLRGSYKRRKRNKIFFLCSCAHALSGLWVSLFHFRHGKLNACNKDTFDCETNETIAKCNQYSRESR